MKASRQTLALVCPTVAPTFVFLCRRRKCGPPDIQNWITDCERFFHFTQQLQTRFTAASVEDKKTLLLPVASNWILKDGEVAVTYSEPYATLSKFSLARQAVSSTFEPSKMVQQSRISKPSATLNFLMDEWLGRLTAIRTFGIQEPMLARL